MADPPPTLSQLGAAADAVRWYLKSPDIRHLDALGRSSIAGLLMGLEWAAGLPGDNRSAVEGLLAHARELKTGGG